MANATNNKGTPANDAPPADGQQSAPNSDGTPPKNTTDGQQTATEAAQNLPGNAPNTQGNGNEGPDRLDSGLRRDPNKYFTHGTQIYGKDMGEGLTVADLDRLDPPNDKTPGLHRPESEKSE